MILRLAHGAPTVPMTMARRLFGTSSASATCTTEESDDRAHGEEMHVAGKIVAAEQRGQFLELHRLPDRQARQHDQDAAQDHAGVKHLLHGVVVREIVMRELEGERGLGVAEHLGRSDRQQLAAEAAGGEAERHIDDAVDHQHPHGGEMPEQRAAQPLAERDVLGKFEAAEQRRGVVDLPAGADHHQDRQRIDPVAHAHPARVDGRVNPRTVRLSQRSS